MASLGAGARGQGVLAEARDGGRFVLAEARGGLCFAFSGGTGLKALVPSSLRAGRTGREDLLLARGNSEREGQVIQNSSSIY